MRRAFGFLTVLGGSSTPTADSLTWFPIVGALIGLAVGGVWWGAEQLWSPVVAAALVIVADLFLTGLLHVDGLADTADGLLPPLPKERRLQVMSDPATGAFGVATVVGVLLVRFASLAATTPAVLAVAGIWCASRTLMAVAVLRLPYARDEGLVSAFRGSSRAAAVPIAALGGALAGVLAFLDAGPQGLGAVGACFFGGVLVLALARVRIDGYTGDVLGAAGVIGETLGLLVLAVNR